MLCRRSYCGIIAAVAMIGSWIVWIIVVIIAAVLPSSLGTLFMGIVGLVMTVLFLAIFVGWIMGMVKAYQREYFKLPVIGNFAEKFSTK
jgi:uncharacterized membrane protein